jgi:hypothetical protein
MHGASGATKGASTDPNQRLLNWLSDPVRLHSLMRLAAEVAKESGASYLSGVPMQWTIGQLVQGSGFTEQVLASPRSRRWEPCTTDRATVSFCQSGMLVDQPSIGRRVHISRAGRPSTSVQPKGQPASLSTPRTGLLHWYLHAQDTTQRVIPSSLRTL